MSFARAIRGMKMPMEKSRLRLIAQTKYLIDHAKTVAGPMSGPIARASKFPNNAL